LGGDKDKITTRYSYTFIHATLAHFFKDTLDYLSAYLYPRFEWTVVGTFDKAVEYLEKKQELGREGDKPNLPALILNPAGELTVSEVGGMQLWRFPNLASGMVKYIYDPIYLDSNVRVDICFGRIKGDIELLILLPSFYEYCDVRLFFLQIFGGLDRPIYPQFFNSFVILPEELYNYEYNNPYTGVKYKLDWEGAGATTSLVKTTNRTENVFPCRIKPLYKLTSLSDASTRYGGADRLADWRLTATIQYEVEIPTYLVLESDFLAENIAFEIKYGSCYSAYADFNPDEPPVNRNLFGTHWSFGLDETSASVITYPTEAGISYRKDLVFRTRYFHTITPADATSQTDIIIALPEVITDRDRLILRSKSGDMYYGDHWLLNPSGTEITIKKVNVTLDAGDIVELYVYDYISDFMGEQAEIFITAPAYGEELVKGIDYDITWDFVLCVGVTCVKIELLKGGVVVETINESTPIANKSYIWTVPWDMVVGVDYQIRITAL